MAHKAGMTAQIILAEINQSLRPKNKIQRAKKYIFLLGGVGYVIGGLRRMEPQDTGAKGQIRKLIGYLD